MALSPVFFVAFLGGVLPALLWLFFWLLEDRCEPEPKQYIFFCFLIGGLAIFPVFYIERAMMPYLTGGSLLFGWAATEELFKFAVAYAVALRAKVFDEPIDAVIYLVTAALGFSAVENTLFLMGPLATGDIIKTIVTGDLRFIGATLLHTLSSATIGLSLAFAFYKPAIVRGIFATCGVILAIVLHTLFNFFILGQGGGVTFGVFLSIWIGIIFLLFMIERVKHPSRDYC
jgi:RsiW-degrading membrane proteinase PrsW (M82 family)